MRARLEDGQMVRGWISIGRGTDSNPAPFDELDQRMFALLAGAVAGFISRGMLINAVAERDEQATHLRYRASHDGLTKALAGHEFRTELSQALHSPHHDEKVLFFIDLDGFKPINDRYGHAAGDAVLVEIATRLRLAVRNHDLVGRMGGDEFAVLASFDGRPQIELIAQRLLDAIHEPITYLDERLMVSASIGVATLGTAEANEMLMSADAAMYKAKAAGGGGWRHASPPATTVTA
jgi:diguanylate cyclase (GGDEF)-like protein